MKGILGIFNDVIENPFSITSTFEAFKLIFNEILLFGYYIVFFIVYLLFIITTLYIFVYAPVYAIYSSYRNPKEKVSGTQAIFKLLTYKPR